MRLRILTAALLFAALLVSSSASALDWPFRIETGDTTITIYSPQIETFEGDIVTARAAMSISLSEAESPVFGAVWFESYALTDRESRTVVLSDVKVLGARFPSLEGENLERYGELVRTEIEEWEFLITLDELNAMLEYVDKQNIAVEGIKNDPPKIYFKSTPAVLILIDGEPKEQDLENTNLKYVVNTAYFIVYDKSSKMYYMRGGPWWYSSKKVDSGYAPVDKVPDEVNSLKRRKRPRRKKQLPRLLQPLKPERNHRQNPIFQARRRPRSLSRQSRLNWSLLRVIRNSPPSRAPSCST